MATTILSPVELESHEIDRRVRNLLWQRPSLRSVTVSARGGTVTLRGHVRSFYDKQLCFSGSRRVPGVRELIDEIEVRRVESAAS